MSKNKLSDILDDTLQITWSLEIMGTNMKTDEPNKKSLGVSIEAGSDSGMNPDRGNIMFMLICNTCFILKAN